MLCLLCHGLVSISRIHGIFLDSSCVEADGSQGLTHCCGTRGEGAVTPDEKEIYAVVSQIQSHFKTRKNEDFQR